MYDFANITHDDIIMTPFGSNTETVNTTAATILIILATLLIERMIAIFWCSVSYKLIVLIVSLTYAAIQEIMDSKLPRLGLQYMERRDALTLMMPVIILRITSCLDWSLFKKCLFQIVVLSTVGTVLFSLIVGYATFLFEGTSNSHLWMHMLVYGLSFSAIDDVEISKSYMEYEAIRDALVILDGEYILSTAIFTFSMHIAVAVLAGSVSKWYQALAISIRYVGLGVIVGYPLGWCITLVLPYMLNKTLDLTLCLLFFVYFVYVFCEYVVFCSGTISTFIACTYAIKFRSRISTQTDLFLNMFIDLVYICVVYPKLLIVISRETHEMLGLLETKYIVRCIATFFTCFIARILVLAILYPVLKLTGKHLQLNSMMVIIWLSKKGVIQLLAVNAFFQRKVVEDSFISLSGHIVFTVTIGILFQSIFTKNFLKSFGLTEAATNKKNNFTNCIELVLAQNVLLMDTIKSYRLFSEINWNKIYRATAIINPFSLVKIDATKRVLPAFCEECKNEVYIKPDKGDLLQVIRETKFRIFKARKVVIQRLFRRNLYEEDIFKYILSHWNDLMESKDIVFKEEKFLKHLMKRTLMDTFKEFLIDIGKEEIVLKPPRKRFRWICYKIVTLKSYDVIVYCLCVSYVVAYLTKRLNKFESTMHFSLYYESTYTVLFSLEIFVKVMAYSHVYVKDGIRLYMSNKMCVLDFLVVLGNALLVSYFLLKPIFSILPPLLIIYGYSMRTICLTRLLRLIVIAYQLRHWFVKIPKKVVSKKISFCYAVTEVLLMCHDDISHMLPTMAINPDVYDHLIQLLEIEQLTIQENICNLNLSSPSIISTHHTKIVHQRTMHFLKASVAHLKKQGFLDDDEYQELVEKFEKKLQSKIDVPQFLKAKDVLKNILWLQESKIFNKVLKTAVEISWKQNDVIIKAGQVATGVIILTEGILMSHYEPTNEDLEQHRIYGTLPIADYHDYKEMAAKASKFLIPGSSIGLLGVLTGRINNATVAATVEGKGFFIPQVFFLENLNKRTDPTIGFYSTLWKIASYDIAYWLLSESRNYRRKTQQELYTYMHRSFVPYLCNRKTFVVTELVKDIVLIEGLVEDIASKTLYSGPVYMPRGIIYIRLLREQDMAEPILWIVPSRKAVLLNILKYEDFEDL